jgi:hypothetical protein
MPNYTCYAPIKNRGRKKHQIRNTVIFTFHERIVDYLDLKNIYRDAARNAYNNHNQQTVTVISIEKHLGGKYIRGMTNYRESRIHFKRLPECKAKITYNPHADTIKVENAVFITPEFYEFKADYDRERGKKWTLKPVVEVGFQAKLLNPESIFTELLTVKNSIYDPMQQEIYGSSQERHEHFGSYTKIPQGMYGPANENTLERDSHERESQH